jgi:tetratricopeptide (TPR) repeat protein
MSSMLKAPKTSPAVRKDRSEAAEEAVSTAYVRTRTFLEEYRAALIAAGVGIAVIFLGVLGYFYWQHGQEQRAAEHLGAILPVYAAGEYEQALAGTDTAIGLEAIAEDYRRTPAGTLASFYAGHAHFQLGQFDEADRFFDRYRGDDMLRASAMAGRASAAEERGEYADAARLFERAASTFRSAATAPDYLLSAARNHEAAGNYDGARRAYETVASEYEASPLAANVPIHLARLDARAAAE